MSTDKRSTHFLVLFHHFHNWIEEILQNVEADIVIPYHWHYSWLSGIPLLQPLCRGIMYCVTATYTRLTFATRFQDHGCMEQLGNCECSRFPWYPRQSMLAGWHYEVIQSMTSMVSLQWLKNFETLQITIKVVGERRNLRSLRTHWRSPRHSYWQKQKNGAKIADRRGERNWRRWILQNVTGFLQANVLKLAKCMIFWWKKACFTRTISADIKSLW